MLLCEAAVALNACGLEKLSPEFKAGNGTIRWAESAGMFVWRGLCAVGECVWIECLGAEIDAVPVVANASKNAQERRNVLNKTQRKGGPSARCSTTTNAAMHTSAT